MQDSRVEQRLGAESSAGVAMASFAGEGQSNWLLQANLGSLGAGWLTVLRIEQVRLEVLGEDGPETRLGTASEKVS